MGERELRAEIAGEAGRGERRGRCGVGAGERLLVERLGEDRLERRVAVAAVEARADTRRAGAGDREALEVADDLLYGAELGEHVVGSEDLADVRADLGAELLGARLPVALAAVAKIAALGREMRLLRAAPTRRDALMRRDTGVGRILIDDREAMRAAETYAARAMPEMSGKIELYQGRAPLFEAWAIEDEIASLSEPRGHARRAARRW